jgi:Uma2 family endonuclease
MGWLIDPSEELIFVYQGDRTISIFEKPQDNLPVPGFASTVRLSVGRVFSWLQD